MINLTCISCIFFLKISTKTLIFLSFWILLMISFVFSIFWSSNFLTLFSSYLSLILLFSKFLFSCCIYFFIKLFWCIRVSISGFFCSNFLPLLLPNTFYYDKWYSDYFLDVLLFNVLLGGGNKSLFNIFYYTYKDLFSFWLISIPVESNLFVFFF